MYAIHYLARQGRSGHVRFVCCGCGYDYDCSHYSYCSHNHPHHPSSSTNLSSHPIPDLITNVVYFSTSYATPYHNNAHNYSSNSSFNVHDTPYHH